jgi:choice-of-anchor B domain-containing protein
MRSPIPVILLGIAALTGARSATAQEPNFGRAIAATETELFIGQPVNWYGPGVVYAYTVGADGRWRESARLMAPDSARMDDFGRVIAADGDRLAVAAPRKRDGAGVVYLFERDGTAARWRVTATLEAPAGGGFGAAMALSGDDLFVGAPRADSTGVVHHFRRSDMTWRAAGVLRPESGAAAIAFGSAMARDGDWLVIGAPGTDANTGAVHFFRRTADRWAPNQVVAPPRAAVGARARVGSALMLLGGRAYVGAPGASSTYLLEAGDDGRWGPVGELHPFDADARGQFGSAMAMVGDEVWVGAPGINRGNGRVYRFLPDGEGGFASSQRFDADSADGTSWPFAFGSSIAAAQGQAVVGMPSRDFGEGRVLVASAAGGDWHQRQLLTGEIFQVGGQPAAARRCEDGRNGIFGCENIEVVAHLPTSALGGERGAWVNDVWGWSDPVTRRDYALVARRDGVSFVDVSDPATPRLVGNLPRTVGTPPSVWRDIKVLSNHAYVVADGSGAHGMQVFDLTRLRGVRGAPVTFAPDTTYHEMFSAHNVVADTAAGFLYVVGANSGGQSCGGGLHMVDARDPGHPVFAGCYNDQAGANASGYTHDAQCVTYRGPDSRYRDHQICVGSNATEINIADVTDKANPMVIGRNSYPNVAYAHQGWFDDEQRYFYMNDELDEQAGTVAGTRTIIWDLVELDDPVVAGMYLGPVRSSDHNLFVKGDRVYESNYGSGLRVLDISDRTNPREVGFFDSAPLNDDGPGHSASQSGAWSNYPFFSSGVIIFTSVREGLFIVKLTEVPIS